MKTKSKLFFWVVVLGIFFVACDKGNNELATTIIDEAIMGEPIDDAIEMGTVSLTAFAKDVIEVTTGKPPTLDAVLDNLEIHIYSIDDEKEIFIANYRDLSEFIELAVGNYDFALFTHDFTSTGVEFPKYGFNGSFVVNADLNTDVNAELSLLDLAVTINFSNDIIGSYPGIKVDVGVDSYFDGAPFVEERWVLDDSGITKYFYMDYIQILLSGISYVNNTGNLIIFIVANDPVSGNEIIVEKTYSGVLSNQHYNITIEKSVPGSVGLNITLGDEEVINDTITFPN